MNIEEKGYVLIPFNLDEKVFQWVVTENWLSVDRYFVEVTSPGGFIYELLKPFHFFTSIETMISIRDSTDEDQEDGIWHDDGSRVLAFSLSLTIDGKSIDGGTLEIRRKNDDFFDSIPTPDYGTAIVFLTGVHGFEHRTRKVLKSKRVILVGWCS